MCDEHTESDNEAMKLSRRGFSVMGASALAACAAGQTPDGRTLAVVERDVEVTTPDGACDAYFVAPATGKHPGVLIWPDIMGLRPAFRQMGKRLAESGYAVLVVNQFYRSLKGAPLQDGENFSQPPVRERLMGLARGLSAATATTDATAFVDWLDAQPQVDKRRKIGTSGYCMGGPLVMRTAYTKANRIGAGATFHGGGLATDQPTSPHLLIPQMKASFLIAVAKNDDEREPVAKETLRTAFAAAGRPAEIEVYPAQHGWCPPDSQVYDQAQAEKAWGRMLALFGTALG